MEDVRTREVILRGELRVIFCYFDQAIFSFLLTSFTLRSDFVPKPPFFGTEGIHVVVLGIQWLQCRFEARVTFTYN